MRTLVATSFLLLCLFGCGKSTPETLVKSGYDEREMDAAIARARLEVDRFTTELAQPTGENHAVKVAIKDGENTEHFWLIDVAFRNGQFEGTINNDPGVVSNIKIGQKWSAKQEEISDWMFMRDGKMFGNYTMRPLLKTLPAAEAAEFRAMFAEP